MKKLLSLFSFFMIFTYLGCDPNQDNITTIGDPSDTNENIVNPSDINDNFDSSLVTIQGTTSYYLLDHGFIQGSPILFYSDSTYIYRAYNNSIDTLKYNGKNSKFRLTYREEKHIESFHSICFYGPLMNDCVVTIKKSDGTFESYKGFDLSEENGKELVRNIVYKNDILGIESKLFEGNYDMEPEEEYVSIATSIEDAEIKSSSLGYSCFSNESREEMWEDWNFYRTYGNIFSDIHIVHFFTVENNIVTYLLNNFSKKVDDVSTGCYMLSKSDVDTSILFKTYEFTSRDSIAYFVKTMGVTKDIKNTYVGGLFNENLEVNGVRVSDKEQGVFLYTFNERLDETDQMVCDFDTTILLENDSLVYCKPISSTKLLVITRDYSNLTQVSGHSAEYEILITVPNPIYNVIIYDVENGSYTQNSLSASEELVLLRVNLVGEDIYLSGDFRGELSFGGVKDSSSSTLSIFSLKVE